MKIIYLQTITNNKDSSIFKNIELFYKSKYAKNLGYVKHNEFLELPTWILELSNMLQNVDDELITTDKIINFTKDVDYVFASVMNTNHKLIYDIVKANPYIQFILGCYDYINSSYNNVIHLNNINFIKNIIDSRYINHNLTRYDYKVFNKYYGAKTLYTMPRLALSNGCKYNCKFCTIGDYKSISNTDIDIRFSGILKDTSTKLVYINDKTFIDIPQTKYWMNKLSNNGINTIIQTTFYDFNKISIDSVLNINVAEIELESYNIDILKKYNKPFADKLIELSNKTINYAKDMKVDLIFNVIIGFPEETIFTYWNTLKFIYNNKDVIININIYPYSDYSINQSEDENNLKGIHKLALILFLKLQKILIKNNEQKL